MKLSKHIAKWMIVILIMAIGIGTFGALSIRNEKDKEENEARPSSYLTNQRSHDIDMEALAGLTGEYQADDSDGRIGGFWHLSISEDFKDNGPYLSVYDSAAGNPGFEGRIMYLKDNIIIIEIDQDLFEQMPLSDWQTEGDGKYAVLDISETEDGNITLGYRGSEAVFIKE